MEYGYCEFCSEFHQGHPFFTESSRILWETKHFTVFPGLGQLVEGYLLIASKQHAISIGDVSEHFYPELEIVVKKVRSVLIEHYRTPVLFEHGPASPNKRGGCCVEHAHLHAMPIQIDLLAKLSRSFNPCILNSFLDLRKRFQQGNPYFFLETNSGKRYVFDIPSQVPSQFIRRIIAEKIGKPDEWDWGVFFGMEKLQRTISRLKGEFND